MNKDTKKYSSNSSDWTGCLNRFAPLLGVAAVYLLFVIIGPESFASARNLETVARQSAIVGMAALGMTMIIILGGIDLSAGSVIALSTVVIAALLQQNYPPFLAAAGGVGAGITCGLVNGLLITRLKLAPFIATLGTLLIVRGAAKGLAHEQKIDAPLTWLNNLIAALAPGREYLLLPPGVWLVIVLALVVGLLLHFTRFGRHIFAIGSNELTARLCGVNIAKVKLAVYILGAGFAGLAGVMQFSRLTVGDPTVAIGLELDVIAAVVIGGGSLNGGEGSVIGSLAGAVIMTLIRAGCSQMGLPNWVQEIVTGAIIVSAVTLDRLRHRRQE